MQYAGVMGVRYETLRAEVLSQQAGRNTGLGLGLLYQQGIPGWLKAWLKTTPATYGIVGAESSSRSCATRPFDANKEEMVAVLAAMALPLCREVIS